MDLNRTAQKFSSTSLAGWDGLSWVEDIGFGALEVYSRFITERTFGAVKRVLICAVPLPSAYKAVRTPDGGVYLLSFKVHDMDAGGVYSYVYPLQESFFNAVIISFTQSSTASGMGGDLTEVPSGPVPCYLERYSSTSSNEAEVATYSRIRILLPSGTVVDTDDEIEADGQRYRVKEVDKELDLIKVHGIEH